MRIASKCTAGLLALLWTAPAVAQPPVDVSAAYSHYFLGNCPPILGRDPCVEFPAWSASATVQTTKWLGIVADVGGFSGRVPPRSQGDTPKAHGYSLMAGARFRDARPKTVRAFAQVLAGPVRITGSGKQAVLAGDCSDSFSRACELRDDVSVTSSATVVAFQPGGGVEITVAPHLAVRAGGDLRVIPKNQGFESTGPTYLTSRGQLSNRSFALTAAEKFGARFSVGVVWRPRG